MYVRDVFRIYYLFMPLMRIQGFIKNYVIIHLDFVVAQPLLCFHHPVPEEY